jgi:chitin disaccharide deacetylase
MGEAQRSLIVNADDFGLSPGINEGIVDAHQTGILTSTSLMVRWTAAAEAAAFARALPRLSVGLHVDLAEWIYANGDWQLTYQVVPLDDVAAVSREILRQLELFRNLMHHDPTHLDSHQHVHRSEPVRSILVDLARELGVVLRSISPQVEYCGDFYGQSNKGDPYPEGISLEGLVRILENLAPGFSELGCHPAKAADTAGMYHRERMVECEILCHPLVRAAVEENCIRLCSFYDVTPERSLNQPHNLRQDRSPSGKQAVSLLGRRGEPPPQAGEDRLPTT